MSAAALSLVLLFFANGAEAQIQCRSDRGGYCVNLGASLQAQTSQAVPGLEFLTLPEGAQPGVLISRLYTFGLGLVGISALLMFIWSGIEYMVARDKEPTEAKKRIGNAVFGLLLALLSWVLLNTINPELVKNLDLGLTKLELKPSRAEQQSPTTQNDAPRPPVITPELLKNPIQNVEDRRRCIQQFGKPVSVGRQTFCERPPRQDEGVLFEITTQEQIPDTAAAKQACAQKTGTGKVIQSSGRIFFCKYTDIQARNRCLKEGIVQQRGDNFYCAPRELPSGPPGTSGAAE